MTSENPVAPVRRAAVIFIFVTVMLDTLAFGIIIPVLPHLVQQMAGGDIATAAKWVGLFGALFGLMQFVFSPIQGALSDRFGRRPVILLSNLGLGIDFIVMALAKSIPILLIGRLVSGIASASFTTANAYIADVTPKDKRAAAFGMMGGAFGIGFIVGPALGGFLGGISTRLPFWIAAGLSLANFLYGTFILPESLPTDRRSERFDFKSANPLGSLRLLRRYPQVFGLAIVLFLVAISQFSLNSTWVLFADYKFGWGPQAVGYTLALVGVCSGFVQVVLIGRATARFGERPVMLAGLFFGICGFLTLGLSPNSVLFLCGIPLLALWGMGGPTAQAIMTHQVDPREQGRLQGAISGLTSLATIFGPFVFTQVFAAFIGPEKSFELPGAAFLLSAMLLASALVLGWRFTAGLQPLTADHALPDLAAAPSLGAGECPPPEQPVAS